MAETPAGWYPNPENPATERWWDGTAWSDQTRPAGGALPPPPAAPPGYGAPGYGAPGYGTPAVGGYGAAAGPKPSNNLVWAILVTLFCCLPFGIVAIVNSARVDGQWASGDHEGARRSAEAAKKWILAAAAVGVVVGIIYVAALASGDGEFSFEVN